MEYELHIRLQTADDTAVLLPLVQIAQIVYDDKFCTNNSDDDCMRTAMYHVNYDHSTVTNKASCVRERDARFRAGT